VTLTVEPESSMAARLATHAGTWYTADGPKLDFELSGWLSNVSVESSSQFDAIEGCKAIIAPHAGYSYSGPTAAWAYRSIDTTGIRRVFVIGPSHQVYIDGCALSTCETYKTPIGDLPLDLKTIAELRATGDFSDMDIATDEDEHSIEMHLPYVRKIFENKDISVVPVLVGAINADKERYFGRLLAPYLAENDTIFVVSSDFCHWGTRFSYTYYYPTPLPCVSPTRLGRSGAEVTSSHPIHASITALDREAMDILALEPGNGKTASQAHSYFENYLKRTKNTICGRHPIGVLLGALAGIQEPSAGDTSPKDATLRWVKYAQSSACKNIHDSSVSYASGYVVI